MASGGGGDGGSTMSDAILASLVQEDEYRLDSHQKLPGQMCKVNGNGIGFETSSDHELARLIQEEMDLESAQRIEQQGNSYNQDGYRYTYSRPENRASGYGYHSPLVHFDFTSVGNDDGLAVPSLRDNNGMKNPRSFSRGRSGVQGGIEMDMSYETLSELEDVSHGVDWDTLAQFTSTHHYKATKKSTSQSKNCSVCLNNFTTGQLVRRLPCLHTFHRKCIDKWFEDHSHCPICNRDIKELN